MRDLRQYSDQFEANRGGLECRKRHLQYADKSVQSVSIGGVLDYHPMRIA